MTSREKAFLVINKVLLDGATLDAAIEQFSKGVDPDERRFIRHLTTTTIRRLGQLDKIINHYSKKKLSSVQRPIRHVLRLGICQLLFMDVATYAAVDTSVKLVETRVPKRLHYLKNTVNAVLRNVDRERETLLKRFANTRHNFPKWVLKSWDERFGQAYVKEMLAQIINEAPLDICLKPDEDSNHWAEILKGDVISDGSIRIEKAGQIKSLEGFKDGAWWVQDVAAQLPARLLGARAGDNVLDLCAAPGGKAAQSAAIGANVTAVDISESRLARLRENMQRLNLDIDVVTSDVLSFNPKKRFNFIMLDAPCSSTGTIRRHPEILHTRKPEDVKELSILQSKMLDHAVSLLNDGGVLVYSVCSMEKEEGPDQINALLERHRSLKRKEVKAEELPGFERAILQSGDVQTLPYYMKDGMDGFFISRLMKQ